MNMTTIKSNAQTRARFQDEFGAFGQHIERYINGRFNARNNYVAETRPQQEFEGQESMANHLVGFLQGRNLIR